MNNSQNMPDNNDEQFDKDDEDIISGVKEQSFEQSEDPDALVESKHRLEKDDGEIPEERPISKNPLARTGAVLGTVGVIMGVLGIVWFGFLAPRPPREKVATSTPTPTTAPVVENESAELKASLALQDQRRTVEVAPTPTPSTTAQQPAENDSNQNTKNSRPVRQPRTPSVTRTVQSPPRVVTRYVQSPPKVVTRYIQSPPRVVTRTVTAPAPQQKLANLPNFSSALNKPVSPLERWTTLANLGELSTGDSTKERPEGTVVAASNPLQETESEPESNHPKNGPSPTMEPARFPTVPKTIQKDPQIPTVTIGEETTADYNSPEVPQPELEQNNLEVPQPEVPQPEMEQNNPATLQSLASGQETLVTNAEAVILGITGDNQEIESSTTTNPTSVAVMTDGEAGIINHTPLLNPSEVNNSPSRKLISTREIALGSSATGRVLVPMTWNEAGQDPTRARTAIELTSDLMAADGTVGLPKGTILVAQPDGISKENRLTSLSAVAIVYKDSTGNTRQQQIPSGTITINGKGNSPLIAQGHFDPGPGVASQDILVGALKGLGKVGEIINRPRSQTTTNSSVIGSSQNTTTTTADPNILAAALEGFFGSTADRIAERSNRAEQEMLSKPNISVIGEGTEVAVFVNAFVKVTR